MTRSNLRDAYECDPASYRMGLLGRLQPVVYPYQSGIPGASTRGRFEFDAANYDVSQAGCSRCRGSRAATSQIRALTGTGGLRRAIRTSECYREGQTSVQLRFRQPL